MKEETKLWFEQAEENISDAMYLYKGSRYSATVYFCHQALEKILKACIIEFKNKIPPKIHQLDKLAHDTSLKFSKESLEKLAETTRHFWRIRYPDFRAFVYTDKKIVDPTYQFTLKIYQWIKKKLLKV